MTEFVLTWPLVFAAAYLVGSLSPAYHLSRMLRGTDLRDHGSRNAGALNMSRQFGVWSGLVVLALDTLKGFVVILAVQQTDFGDTGLFWAALGVVVGHNWPAYLRFKGGKGVATVFGVSLAVLPVLTVLSVVIAVVSGLITRNVIFGISIAFVTLNILTIITGQSAATVITCLVLSGIIILAHFGLAHREVLASIRAKGVWGLFEVD